VHVYIVNSFRKGYLHFGMPATESAPLTENPEVRAFSFFVICSCLVCVTWLHSSSVWCNHILSRLNVFLHYNNITLQVIAPPFEPLIKCSIWNLARASHGFACVMVIPLCLLPFNDILSSEKRKLHGAVSDE